MRRLTFWGWTIFSSGGWGRRRALSTGGFRVSLRELAEEYLQASVVHPRQVQAEALLVVGSTAA